MGGTGSKQEDQIITVAIEKQTGAKFTYIPFKGGGTVAVQLVGKHIDSSVNNPIEAVAHWRGGKLRPLCVFDDQAHAVQGQDHRATCRGTTSRPARRPGSTSNYLMLRGIFMPGGVTPDQVEYYVELLEEGARRRRSGRSSWRKARSTRPRSTARSTPTGSRKAEALHVGLMKDAGFIAGRSKSTSAAGRARGLPTRPARSVRVHGSDDRDATQTGRQRGGVRTRTAELVVAGFSSLIGAIVICDSRAPRRELGRRTARRRATFPFYIGLHHLRRRGDQLRSRSLPRSGPRNSAFVGVRASCGWCSRC